ncbi:MAG: hypothetical protein K2G70_07060 [Turicibacter sp.]|nr:hypothetical protein [Turicibacter sp.]
MSVFKPNKVLSVVVDDFFIVEYDPTYFLEVHVFQVGVETKELVTHFDVKEEPKTIEELAEIALEWRSKYVGEIRVVDSMTPQGPATLGQLDLHSQNTMAVEINNIKFIIGEEVPQVMIVKNGEVIEEDFQMIFSLSDLERYVIKWYYANELGIEF